MFCNSSCVPENANAAAAAQGGHELGGVKASDSSRSAQKEGERWDPANLPALMAAPTPQKFSQGMSALPHGLAEVEASSSSSLSQQIEPLPVPQFTAQAMDFAKPNHLAYLAFGELT